MYKQIGWPEVLAQPGVECGPWNLVRRRPCRNAIQFAPRQWAMSRQWHVRSCVLRRQAGQSGAVLNIHWLATTGWCGCCWRPGRRSASWRGTPATAASTWQPQVWLAWRCDQLLHRTRQEDTRPPAPCWWRPGRRWTRSPRQVCIVCKNNYSSCRICNVQCFPIKCRVFLALFWFSFISIELV